MVRKATEAIKSVYPDAMVNSKKISGGTGCFEVTIIAPNIKSKKIFSKLGGEGKFDDSKVDELKKRLTTFIEANKE